MSSRFAARRLAMTRRSISYMPMTSRLTAPTPRLTSPRLTPPASHLTSHPTPSTPASQRRRIGFVKTWFNKRKLGPKSSDKEDPARSLDDPKVRKEFLGRTMKRGAIAPDNIFEEEIAAVPAIKAASDPIPDPGRQRDQDTAAAAAALGATNTDSTTAMVLDPNPRGRIRWHRRKVVQMVRNPDATSLEERLRRHERELVHSSPFLGTSLKKLVMLSRQVAGLPVAKAIEQMRWSKKKFAKEVLYYLEESRDLAIAQCGMGLGSVNGQVFKEPRRILSKEGKWMTISDPTRIYVHQSWVARGPWVKTEIDYKGRGRNGTIKVPSTKIFFVLKEEKTRLRESEEREQKKRAKGPWVHHPNRPLIGQRPYYSW